MSFLGAGNTSDLEQDKGVSEYRLSRSNNNLSAKPTTSKYSDVLWNNKDDSDSEISDSGNFLAKGAFLLTPSHELSMERAALICEKMNFKVCFSLTKTATGILFKFSHPEDYQAVFKKGFHKVTGARFYRKVAVPCRPQKTFTLFVFDIPEDIPIEDVRHSMFRFNSIVEVVRLILHPNESAPPQGTSVVKSQILNKVAKEREEELSCSKDSNPSPIRITLASLDEYNLLLQNGLDFYGATFFPTEASLELAGPVRIATKKGSQLLPAEVLAEDDELLQRPDDEKVAEATEATRRALEKLTNQKVSAALPVRAAEKAGPAQYIRYTPSQQGDAFNSGAKQRVIRMVEAQVDPMEPPKFKINQKIPRGPPSPPAPVLHSPSRKVTVKEQKEWKVPPCISNWKNAKGYTIPLDKRLAADGRGLQQVHINEKFAKMAEALYIADRKAREAVEARTQLEKKLAAKDKEAKEQQLRQMAQRARDERAGIRPAEEPGASAETRERDDIRADRHRDRVRDRNLARAAPDKRSKLQRERERDISEQIALGMPAKSTNNGETMFDQRLFNTTKGMDSGYGDDEAYNVYDKPWRDANSMGSHLYRPSKQIDQDLYGGDLDKIVSTNRFVPDKEFSGTDRSAQNARTGPVQFEKEEDPFGLDQFLNSAKRTNRKDDKGASSSQDRGEKKRRRE